MNKVRKEFVSGLAVVLMIVGGLSDATAVSKGKQKAVTQQDASGVQRYIIELQDQPLATYDGRALSVPSRHDKSQLTATSIHYTGEYRLDVSAPASTDYLEFLSDRQDSVLLEVAIKLGRHVTPNSTYQNVLNGMALDLTAEEALQVAELSMVKSVSEDTVHHMLTYAGPKWLKAESIWDGLPGLAASKGEGVIVGSIDGGINWDHPSFADPGQDGYIYTNPLGNQVGLCSMAQVMCNNKLIGVYDFVEDLQSTEIIEGSTNGKDDDGHGSHTSSTAAGNTLNVTINGVDTTISGVAPHANLITYRVCDAGNPDDPEDGGCQGTAILDAIDQAVTDDVDIINYSLGGAPFNPWSPGQIPRAFLNARNAGIVVVAAAGNEGPDPGTMGSPAHAPWVLGVGNATHDRVFGTVIENLSGGDTAPPVGLAGASEVGSSDLLPIVHAKDFGFAECGTGPAELAGSCAGNVGNSNPWDGDTPFTGMIVVCDRGTYGRIEKGKNVMLAGAEGYILANTNSEGEGIVPDPHCLPASHIGDLAGDKMRQWLDSGENHQGQIGPFELAQGDALADLVNDGSSRGPNPTPVDEILKPNMIAPGTSILAAIDIDDEFASFNGTSMASPHVAGAAALLKAIHPDWSVAQIASALETTSTDVLAHTSSGEPSTPFDHGSGRVQLDDAANAGLFLDVTTDEFNAAEPSKGGQPNELNLAGFAEKACINTCSFSRTVTDQVGGAQWSASPMGFPANANVTITPSNFTLGDGASRKIKIDLDLSATGKVNEWLFGKILLSSDGLPDQYLTAAVFYSLESDLPLGWVINDDRNGGWKDFQLAGLPPMADATFTSGGLVKPKKTKRKIKEDPTAGQYDEVLGYSDDVFDGSEGTFTKWHTVPANSLMLYAETLESTSFDLDLYVGRDTNENGEAEKDEILCGSISEGDLERCDILRPEPGEYWILVQNWDGKNNAGDQATLLSAVVKPDNSPDFAISGPGIVEAASNTLVRLSWDNHAGLPEDQYIAAVGIGTSRNAPLNVGVIPVTFTRNGIANRRTMPLFNNTDQMLALPGDGSHDRIYFDVPPDVTQLDIEANGATDDQSNNLSLEIFREDFADALANPPFVQMPGGLNAITMADGGGGNGPVASINGGGTITEGRYYVKLINNSGEDASVTIRASATSNESTLSPHQTLWGFGRRISQGISWDVAGSFEAGLWYTYDSDGQPTWFIFSSAVVMGNVWTTELIRVTNDGALQQEKPIGRMSITFISDTEAIFSYRLYGEAGFDPLKPNSINTCPTIDGGEKSYNGLWGRGIPGLGGATVVVYEASQAQIHYLFDGSGIPRWLIAADDDNQSATAKVIPLLQFHGFCALCAETDPDFVTVGTVDRTFDDESNGSWTLVFDLEAPLSQMIDRTDDVKKISDTNICK